MRPWPFIAWRALTKRFWRTCVKATLPKVIWPRDAGRISSRAAPVPAKVNWAVSLIKAATSAEGASTTTPWVAYVSNDSARAWAFSAALVAEARRVFNFAESPSECSARFRFPKTALKRFLKSWATPATSRVGMPFSSKGEVAGCLLWAELRDCMVYLEMRSLFL